MKFILTDLLASWARSLPLKASNIGPVIVQESYDTSSFLSPSAVRPSLLRPATVLSQNIHLYRLCIYPL